MIPNRLKANSRISVLLILFIVAGFFNVWSANKAKTWTGSWAASPQLVEPNNMPPAPGLTNNTLRQIVRVSIGGDIVRVRFSNLFSKQPVTMKSVTIAISKGGSSVEIASLKLLKFEGKSQVTMQPGSEVQSDTLKWKLIPGSRIAITIAFGETSASVTGHPGSRTTSYVVGENHSESAELVGEVPVDHWYTIEGIDVQTSSKAGAIAVLGNSITDGRGSAPINKTDGPIFFRKNC
jgi:hypothetical protein